MKGLPGGPPEHVSHRIKTLGLKNDPAGIHEMCGGTSSACQEDKACQPCRDEGFVCERANSYHWQCNRSPDSKLSLTGRR